ncbi:hypothetical protein [Nocardiopsis sp. NRRL B-16309]|uniref:hypothetical protein n=1 Tax=Nocardiopsis sp. NRRL B-16309 TaxID=1519494 RepID=UPI0006AF7808|nr:hypothetical protein [Nocardiopsis sp. NRRL B-16309]KOX11018.1 hypothetical protein ADL05_24345 [Nocardiopsis sp. NRRL B-16309]
MPRRRTPQDDKRLSYTKDRRNEYGENDKSSRKSIRRAQRHVARANRRAATHTLATIRGTADTGLAEQAQERFERKRPRRWEKWPDEPLHVSVTGSLEQRAEREGPDSANTRRLTRLRARLRRPDRS